MITAKEASSRTKTVLNKFKAFCEGHLDDIRDEVHSLILDGTKFCRGSVRLHHFFCKWEEKFLREVGSLDNRTLVGQPSEECVDTILALLALENLGYHVEKSYYSESKKLNSVELSWNNSTKEEAVK